MENNRNCVHFILAAPSGDAANCIFPILHFGVTKIILVERKIGRERASCGSAWAYIKSGRRHALQDAFYKGPGPGRGHLGAILMNKNMFNLKNIYGPGPYIRADRI